MRGHVPLVLEALHTGRSHSWRKTWLKKTLTVLVGLELNPFPPQSHAELLAMNLWGCGLWVAASYVLYRKRVFLAL